MRYERPAIERRVHATDRVIRVPAISTPTWTGDETDAGDRRMKYERPAIERRVATNQPVIRAVVGSPPIITPNWGDERDTRRRSR